MAIEVTSVPDQRFRLSLRATAQCLRALPHKIAFGRRRVILISLAVILGLGLAAGIDSLLRSYRYYSRIIDERLAGGYLTSRPGLYAAPRTLRAGQGLSADELVKVLRRAGYVESNPSDVWSGSFKHSNEVVEIRPNQSSIQGQTSGLSVVRVSFERQLIAKLTADGMSLDSFTLEPEVLTNDLSVKQGQRNTTAYNEIPPILIHAILSIEDRRFFEHPGLDLFGVGRALLRNAGDERIGQGGSTITQQLVKNTYLSPERTFRRKFAEAMLAFALERRLSKQDILALYCNEIYLGQRGALAVRGVDVAAHCYFGKELRDLSLAEAATIAGMIQSPSRYSPVGHAEAAQRRRNAVLEAMARDGWIDSAHANSATQEPVTVVASDGSTSVAPFFIDYVNRIAESQFSTSGEQQRIYTTIDLNLQQLAEAALKRQLDRLDSVYKGRKSRTGKPQAALVALDPHNGNVLAMVGGRDYAESQLNRATDAQRQPGSTFKPFVYAAAIEDGISPLQMFSDAPRDFVYDRNKVYRPANFGGGYSMRDVTMRTGLVKSLNVVTVDVAIQTGLARIANLAQGLGLPRPGRYPALALGTGEVTPLQLAAAYASFVNGGKRVVPKVVASVAEPPGSHTMSSSEDAQVISPTTAYMLTNMLAAVVDHGTARAARGVLRGTAIAGKTGTSRDGWFVGYTPNLVCAVWIGFDDNQQLGLTGAAAALPAWTEFMKGAVGLRPELGGGSFECPEGIKFVEIDSDTGLLSTLTCPNRELVAITDHLAPNLECYTHGNLPGSIEEEMPLLRPDLTDVVQTRPTKTSLISLNPSSLKSTRVDLDAKGRRTLVNAMR